MVFQGASIGNRCVSISRVETSVDESIPQTSMDEFVPENEYLSNFDTVSSSNASQMHRSVSTPGEAGTGVQQVVTSLMAKGKEAFIIAKALDESYQVSSTAATKVGELSDKLGLTSKIKSGMEVAKSIDKKYHVSNTAMTAASATGRKAVATANAVVSSSYFSKGALCVASVLDHAARAAANLGQRGAPK
ncbi:OLC1v1009534C2 [Oldenlandia corymbosa var. corymbosa]|uniref:OLC1v1009534C2 n=1 Tax=Oldenlandia corymbosa var. corymbosa TaxID=529605 RepID=A0AAV1DPQ0_OLDCO|nr:OLC1v1009534C2 [Oldenlandia corymbosa var. corymbosa]